MIGLPYRAEDIAEAVGGRLVGYEMSPPLVDRVIIDSREAEVTPSTLFIALKGPRHDGHDHIPELLQRGIGHFLVDEAHANRIPGARLIVVKDTLAALQQFAAHHRSHFKYPVIGITGSNGKTIVKEWLSQMLHTSERIVRSPGSWNSQVGVPLSVLRMGHEHTLAIFEAGISKPGEMEQLEPIIRPTIGVLTHIGDAHDEGFGGDRALKVSEKSKLFDRAAFRAVTSIVAVHVDGGDREQRQVLVGDQDARSAVMLKVLKEERNDGSCSFETSYGTVTSHFELPFDDHASMQNALTCIAVCLHLGRSPAWINERLTHLTAVDMRLRTMQGRHGTTLIDDSYSSDRSSLAVALDHQRRIAHGRERVVVLSDIAEVGADPAQLYREIARMLGRAGVARVIGVGSDITAQRALFAEGSRFHATTEAMLAVEDPKDLAGAVVLIKGARSFGFERIVEHWQQQVHGTELEIDLEAVRHNLNHYRALLAPGVRMMAMVKAFGYGAGALELARLFQHERVHYLGVAYADEGIELRSHGIEMPIMVMNPEPVAMETLHRFRLEAEVYDLRSLREANVAAQRMPEAPPVHIKLDTGMHRLGFTGAELPLLLEELRAAKSLRVASVLSHMAVAEDPGQDAFTRTQIEMFTGMANAIDDVLGYKPLRHIANSAGISRWPAAHFDMVRAGIGLHGIGINAKESALLRSVASLRTVIAQVKAVKAGDTIGYGRMGELKSDVVIAVLPIGYADGLSRRLGNGVGRVWVDGKAAPIVGNVCMDMCMVDVTGFGCAVGDDAVIFDGRHPISEVARDMGTIPYEVLTSISARVKRVYVRG